MTILHVRASSTDPGWSCVESLFPGEPSVKPMVDGAEIGSAFHEWSRTRADADLEEIATRYAVSADELDMLVAYSMVAERELRKWFGDAATERSLSIIEPWDCPPYDTIQLTGSVDRSAVLGESGAVLDYKTGMIEGGYEHQQRAYAFLLQRDEPDITEVESATVYVRHGYWRGRTYTVESLEAWWHDFKRRLVNGMGRFTPGAHCGFCPRRPTCPGVAAYEKHALAVSVDGLQAPALVEITADNKAIVGPELAETRRKVVFIKKRCEEFLDVVRAKAMELGDIPAGDGMVLRIVEQNRRELDALKAWPVLAARLNDEEIAGTCDISMRKVQNAVAGKAAHGCKGYDRTKIAEELEAAGAISINVVKQLREAAE